MENRFESMICPVCGKYEFVDDTDLKKNLPIMRGTLEISAVIAGGYMI